MRDIFNREINYLRVSITDRCNLHCNYCRPKEGISFINHFCSTCNRLRLTADGKLRVCLLKDVEIDLKKPLREKCGDTDLENLIREAVLLKPKDHDLACSDNSLKKCLREMSTIGG